MAKKINVKNMHSDSPLTETPFKGSVLSTVFVEYNEKIVVSAVSRHLQNFGYSPPGGRTWLYGVL